MALWDFLRCFFIKLEAGRSAEEEIRMKVTDTRAKVPRIVKSYLVDFIFFLLFFLIFILLLLN